MFLVWLQSRCSPQGHPPSTFLFLSSLFKQQIGRVHDSADRPGRGQGQTGFLLSGEAERRSLARQTANRSPSFTTDLGSPAPSLVETAGLRRRPRPTTNSRLSEEAFGTGQTAAPTTDMVIPAGFFKGEGAL